MITRQEKVAALAQLAARRRARDAGSKSEGYTRDYKRLEEFHGGFYDRHNWVGPWSITACNVDSDVMLVAQDWASEDFLGRRPNDTMQELGHDPSLQTNKNVKTLLRAFFGRDFNDVFATDAFVFIKPKDMGGTVHYKDLRLSVQTYTLREIEIVRPKMVICIGGGPYNAIRHAVGLKYQSLKSVVYTSPEVRVAGAEIYGVPHVGGRGLSSTGGMVHSRSIWQQLANRLAAISAVPKPSLAFSAP